MPHTTRQGPQHDAGVLWVVWLLGWIQRTLNELAYDWLQWIASRRTFVNWLWVACEVKRKPKPPFVVRSARWLARLVRLAPRHSRTDLPTLWMNFNYAYALVWLVVILGGYIALACWHPLWFRDLVVALAAWRVAEILTWQLKMLLDRTHRLILAAERNLVFLFIDGFVTVTAIAVLLRQAPKIKPTTTPFTTWVDSVSTITLNGRPARYDGDWANAAALVGTAGGLLLIGAGLAMLVGLIQEKFLVDSHEYTGPTRITKPRRDGVLPRRSPSEKP